jgi:hypothetical protein
MVSEFKNNLKFDVTGDPQTNAANRVYGTLKIIALIIQRLINSDLELIVKCP